ncbi:hypothetical protein BOTBODRAFT_176789 [Botryobasidium botryosum FD-172 SS1]|uniref:MYND-type domain-containing protein n=1 Tax=Botryobasidium botryosum (strain FD-172 SS1) TaxID=930990 RepID=A0A067M8X8_BOTB1|nr:hypothetical protein BOTBODRAFT_176789 [Botryobasidium botryosum FD-172 SS1]
MTDITRQCHCCKREASASESFVRCGGCRAIYYCSPACQTDNWPSHRGTCESLSSLRAQRSKTPPPATPTNVPAVDLLGGEKIPFNPREIVLTTLTCDEILAAGVVSPISQLIGVPLVIHRHMQEDSLQMPLDASLDNQAATYLMVSPESGYAPLAWQQCIGPVTIVRADRRPLTSLALEMIWDYVEFVLDDSGDEGVPRWRYTPQAFQEWCRRHRAGRIDKYRGLVLPL